MHVLVEIFGEKQQVTKNATPLDVWSYSLGSIRANHVLKKEVASAKEKSLQSNAYGYKLVGWIITPE